MDTIVALSTAPGNGGIGIIRMSGKDCFDILNKIFIPKNKEKEIKGYTIKYGEIAYNNEIIDEVLVSYFLAPKSYTTENMCEINSHGGIIVTNKILELCIKNGARLAEPGEFTKKAFLNGRIDLSQAEAIIDIINSKTEKELKASTKQLEGFLSKEIQDIKSNILEILVDIEASIDYPEYDIEEVTNQKAMQKLLEIKEKEEKLLKSFDNGKIIKQGLNVAIIGKPNAGKSSLLNAILKEERAIVTNIEGTTRDTIEEFIVIDGIPVKIIDTAGIRNANDEIEKIGIEKSKKMADEADLIITVIDSSSELSNEDKEILEFIKDKKGIIVLNKNDLKTQIDENTYEINTLNKKVIKISALNKKGIDEIYKQISEMFNFGEIVIDESTVITSQRQKEAIENALKNTIKCIETIANKMPIDIVAIHLTENLKELGKITGETVSEEIIKEIFKKFCLGK